MKIALVEFDVSMTKSQDIGRACTRLGRFQWWSLLEWAMVNPELLKKFFIRMTRDVGFHKFYTNLYDLLRVCHLRLFEEKALVIVPVEETLYRAVISTLGIEKTELENAEAEVTVRRRRVDWLENLSQDWELKEWTRRREDVPVVPGSKPKTGQKRS